VDTATLSAIIYTERTLNVDWRDDALDVLLAKSGQNSSIDFCQIKMKTAYFIELSLADSLSAFYPGRKYRNLLSLSKSPQDLITNLQTDSLNLHYAAAYLRIIMSYWEKAGYPINNRPDIVGTLYSTGLYKKNGEIRLPNPEPKPNDFGRKTLNAFRLFDK